MINAMLKLLENQTNAVIHEQEEFVKMVEEMRLVNNEAFTDILNEFRLIQAELKIPNLPYMRVYKDIYHLPLNDKMTLKDELKELYATLKTDSDRVKAFSIINKRIKKYRSYAILNIIESIEKEVA